VAADIATGAVGVSEIAVDSVGPSELQDNSIDSGEIIDGSLTNQDIGVLFAEVDYQATVQNSSGGVTATKLGVGTGEYEVDFGRNVTACTAVATVGSHTTGQLDGDVSVADRSGNAEAVWVRTRSTVGPADRPFRLVVVC
jgi:hypothetical protein